MGAEPVLPNRRPVEGCSGSRGSRPLHTSNQRAVSRTDRERQPWVTVIAPQLGVGRQRDASVRGLQPDQAGEAGGDPDRAAAVAAGAERDEPAGDRRRGAAGRSTGGRAELPRVVRRAVEHGAGDVDATELGRRRLAHQHGAAAVAARARVGARVRSRSASRYTTQACVSGQPSTWSSSLTPIGTPPNGFDDVGAPGGGFGLARDAGARTR